MGKDPAFLFYPNDWLGGTMGMTFEEKGAYISLLMMQFNRGHMTAHMIGQEVGQLWDKIKDKFIQDSQGLWYNERLDIEKTNRQSFVQSRRNNINGNNQYTKKEEKEVGHMGGHTTGRMENRNEDVINNKKGAKKIKIFAPPTCEEVKSYFISFGYLPEVGERAYNWYASADWHDAKGNAVKNWKQKMQRWFTPENKVKSFMMP